MAKAKTKSLPEVVSIRYDLHELPTAQHKAGLAGLILQIESMKERKKSGHLREDLEIPEVSEQTASSATIRFNRASVQELFDDLYSAEVVEVKSASKWPSAKLKEERPNPDPKEGEPKRYFIYEVVEPSGPFLHQFTDDKEAWHKLWRNMLWTIPRGRPTTRFPFNSRAAGQPTKEGADVWKGLLANERSKASGGFATVELAGAIMIGAQAVNAEGVGFEDRSDHALLLHFWILTVRIFVPEVVDAEGQRQFAGYVLAIPDVRDLSGFCKAYKRMLNDLTPKMHGYRPADAVISLPDQGALEYMRHLADLAERKVLDEGPSRYVAGVEFFHLVRVGQNVKTASHGRVPPHDALLALYAGIWKEFHNPVFLSAYLRARLRGRPGSPNSRRN